MRPSAVLDLVGSAVQTALVCRFGQGDAQIPKTTGKSNTSSRRDFSYSLTTMGILSVTGKSNPNEYPLRLCSRSAAGIEPAPPRLPDCDSNLRAKRRQKISPRAKQTIYITLAQK